jgi:hypothetical protein
MALLGKSGLSAPVPPDAPRAYMNASASTEPRRWSTLPAILSRMGPGGRRSSIPRGHLTRPAGRTRRNPRNCIRSRRGGLAMPRTGVRTGCVWWMLLAVTLGSAAHVPVAGSTAARNVNPATSTRAAPRRLAGALIAIGRPCGAKRPGGALFRARSRYDASSSFRS